MAFLDTLKAVGEKGLDKAKDLGDIGKNKLEITKAESEIKKLYESIATELLAKEPELIKEKFPEQFHKIEDLKAQIEKFKAAIEEINK